ncbi:PorH family porin [Corynebacterium sp.]|uniref:PorH family porin n=1 Tax=Corynebacterium sp. TaxID=1720 RepID=UPI0026DBFF47|nr:PorH family porin [Corynebacterium sp.]MDO5032282.1 PorH family porin [Corynebacterium sp.]
MDLSFIGDQLDNFSTFVGGLKDIFKGFASLFDTIDGAVQAGESGVKPNVSGFAHLSSNN